MSEEIKYSVGEGPPHGEFYSIEWKKYHAEGTSEGDLTLIEGLVGISKEEAERVCREHNRNLLSDMGIII